MFNRILATVAVLFVVVGFVAAETYRGLITAVSKDEVTIMVRKDKKDKKGEEKKIKLGKDAKFVKMMKKEKSDSTLSELEKAIETAGKKGAFGSVTTEGEGDKEVATEVGFGGGKKK